jgi:hypothetical protein
MHAQSMRKDLALDQSQRHDYVDRWTAQLRQSRREECVTYRPSNAVTLGLTTLCWQAEDGDLDLVNFDGDDESYAVDWSKRAFCPVEDYAFDIQKSLRGRWDERFAVNIYDKVLGVNIFQFPQSNDDSYVSVDKFGRSNNFGLLSACNLSHRVENIASALTSYGLQTTNETVRGEAIDYLTRVPWSGESRAVGSDDHSQSTRGRSALEVFRPGVHLPWSR